MKTIGDMMAEHERAIAIAAIDAVQGGFPKCTPLNRELAGAIFWLVARDADRATFTHDTGDGEQWAFTIDRTRKDKARPRPLAPRAIVPRPPQVPARPSLKRNPCGRCGACDGLRFRAWRARVEAGLAGSTDDEDSARFRIVEEIHRDRSGRHPLGIAQRLSWVIDALHGEDDDTDAVTDLADLEEDERRSIELNGERNLGCCSAGAKAFREGA